MATYKQFSHSGGMQLKSNRFLVRPTELALAKNVSGNVLGSLQKRLGFTKTGDTVSDNNDILGLFALEQVDGTDKHLTVANGTLKYNNSNVWTTIGGTSFPATARVEFASFLDKAFIVGADSSNSYLTTGTVDGTTYATTSFPKARYATVLYDQLYLGDAEVAGTRYSSRIYYSSFPTAAGVITFNTTDDFIQVQTEDGDWITGMTQSNGRLLIFKRYSLHTWEPISKTLRPVDTKGTTSNRSIQNFGNAVIYLHYSDENKAVMMWNGAQSIEISRKVEPFLRGMTAANAITAASGRDNNHYYLYIGDVTLDARVADYYGISATQSNILLDYSIQDDAWAVHSLPYDVTVMAPYNSNLYFGDTEGDVHQWNLGNSDNTAGISAEVVIHNISPQSASEYKDFQGVFIHMNTASLAKVFASVDNGEWKPLGECKERVNYFSINQRGYSLRFKIQGYGTEQPFIFDGYELEYELLGKVLK